MSAQLDVHQAIADLIEDRRALAEELAEAHLNHEFLPYQWRERALMEGFDAWARNMYGWEKRR